MRYLLLALAALILCSQAALAKSSKTPKPSCKKIRDAVWANKTLEQIMAEFETDAQTVMKCTQKQGKRKAGPKPPRKKGSKSSSKSKTHSSGKSTTQKSTGKAPAQKPKALRSGPLPAHMP